MMRIMAAGSSSEADVLRVVTAFDVALQRGDYEAAARLCTPDFVFIGSGEGEECSKASELPSMMRSLVETIRSDFVSWKLTFSEPPRIAMHGDAALVTRVGDAELLMRDSSRRTRYRWTGVLRRDEGGWRWWMFHGSEAQPW